jgi:O-antigen/teichoic acid export membrane protein
VEYTACSRSSNVFDRVAPESAARQLAGDVPLYVLAQAALGLSGLAGLFAFAHILGPVSYGYYALAAATVSITDTVAFGWIHAALMRYMPELERRPGGAGTCLATFGSCVGFIGGVIAIVWLAVGLHWAATDAVLRPLVGACLLTLEARVIFEFAIAFQRARRETLRYAAYTAFYALGGVAAAVGMLLTIGAKPQSVFYGLTIVAVVAALFESRRFWRELRTRTTWFDTQLARRAMSYGLPLLVSTSAGLILSLADRYMIDFMLNSHAVGVYSVGYDISDKAMKLTFYAITGACLPVALRTYSDGGETESIRLISRVTRICILIMIPVAMGLATTGHLVVEVMAGNAFAESAGVLPWIAAGVFCLGLSQVLSQIFLVRENTRLLMWMLVAAAGLNIALNLVLIPYLGIMGAAYSTFATYAIYLAIAWVAAGASAPHIFEARWLAKVFGATTVAYLLMRAPALDIGPVALALLLKGTAGSLGYAAVLALLGEKEISGLYRLLIPTHG